jgi:hypothetical protein
MPASLPRFLFMLTGFVERSIASIALQYLTQSVLMPRTRRRLFQLSLEVEKNVRRNRLQALQA